MLLVNATHIYLNLLFLLFYTPAETPMANSRTHNTDIMHISWRQVQVCQEFGPPEKVSITFLSDQLNCDWMKMTACIWKHGQILTREITQ